MLLSCIFSHLFFSLGRFYGVFWLLCCWFVVVVCHLGSFFLDYFLDYGIDYWLDCCFDYCLDFCWFWDAVESVISRYLFGIWIGHLCILAGCPCLFAVHILYDIRCCGSFRLCPLYHCALFGFVLGLRFSEIFLRVIWVVYDCCMVFLGFLVGYGLFDRVICSVTYSFLVLTYTSLVVIDLVIQYKSRLSS